MSSVKIYTDGGARGNPGPAASAFVVIKNGEEIYSHYRYLGKSTNNFAEYHGIIDALSWLKENPSSVKEIDEINFFLDSLLVVNQLNGEFKVKEPTLAELFKTTRRLIGELDCSIKITHVSRDKNKRADSLVNKALDENMRNFT